VANTGMKSLAKDTAIYGMSSIIGRFLNWMLVPMYVRLFTEGEYGIVTNIYAYVAFVFVLLTYGMETTFFRYVNKDNENPGTVYSTTLISLLSTSSIFTLVCFLFSSPISSWMGYAGNENYIIMMAATVSIDAFCCIPFAYLRYKKRPIRFASLKLLSIFLNIGLNIFFLILCPQIYKSNPELISSFYNPDFGIGYIFVSNLIASVVTLLFLFPQYTGFNYSFDKALFKRMLKYTWPLLILGIAGVINQTFDKMIFPLLFSDRGEAEAQLGIYSACAKIAVVMTMATQAFRYAYEPFVFAKTKDKDNKTSYAMAMKFFIIFGFLIFLGIMFYMDILKHILKENYFEGLKVVPVLMTAEIFFGVYFNLSLWYKLTEKTYFGAIFSTIGCLSIILINIVFIPIYGYMACAWASFICNFIMMLLSYIFGQKYYPIKYDFKSILLYLFVTIGLYCAGTFIFIDNIIWRLIYRTVLLSVFMFILIKRDLPFKGISDLNKLVQK